MLEMRFETYPGDEYWNDTGKARDMSLRAWDVWQRRLTELSRDMDAVDADNMLSDTLRSRRLNPRQLVGAP